MYTMYLDHCEYLTFMYIGWQLFAYVKTRDKIRKDNNNRPAGMYLP